MPDQLQKKKNSSEPYSWVLVYLATALVPSEIACFASSPGSRRRTAIWISRDDKVDFFP